MFKFFRFKNKEEFDSSVNEHFNRNKKVIIEECSFEFQRKFYGELDRCVGREVSELKTNQLKYISNIEARIVENEREFYQKINDIEERINILSGKLDVILQILRIGN